MSGVISPDPANGLDQASCQDLGMFQRLVKREGIRQVSPGKFYLDIEAAQAFRRGRRERALNTLLIVLGIAAGLIYFSIKM